MENLSPEWQHNIRIDDLGSAPKHFKISAPEQARKDVARRIGVQSIERLEAHLIVEPKAGNSLFEVKGDLSADVTQNCVLTGEALHNKIEDKVEGWFTNNDSVVSINKARNKRQGKGVDVEIEMTEEKDDPEPAIDGQIDLGELVVQHLSLSVESYPQKEGAQSAFPSVVDKGQEIPPVRRNPFAVLKDWKAKKE